YSGQEDICVGTPIANRQPPELENPIDGFVNTLVVRAKLAEDATAGGLLRQIKDTALSMYAHQDISFEHLLKALTFSLSYSPLFQVMFVLLNNEHGMKFPDLTVPPAQGDIQTPH